MRCGIGKYAFQMVNKLRASGNVVNILSPEEGGGDFTSNLRGWCNILKIFKYALFYDQIILQYHESFFYDDKQEKKFMSILATHLSFYFLFIFLKKKIEVIIHEIPSLFSSKLDSTFEKTKWAFCPKLIFHTQKEIKDFESRYFKLSSNKYELRAHHADFFKFREVSKNDARKELGIPLNTLGFLCIGFIQPHKGFDRAIQAFSKVNNHNNMELYIVGSLRVTWGEYVSYLHDLKNMAGEAPNVHVIEKYLSDEAFDTWISSSDVIITPYRDIWSSGIIARAKLFGKPAISSDVGGVTEQLTDIDILFKDDDELGYIFMEFSNMVKGSKNAKPDLRLSNQMSPYPEGYQIFLDYPINPIPRYGHGKPAHPKLYEIIDRNRMTYHDTLKSFLNFKEYFLGILRKKSRSREPYWINEWMPGLDAVAIYSFLCLNNPRRYFEIGSGNSSKFARRAINDHRLQTKIISIDPHPRAEIDSICNIVIRYPLENIDLKIFDELEAGDILFIDGSHRTFMNSDATVVFLDILPMLKQGVLVGFHDIYLPYDYPPEWQDRYYSEQYLLATYILSGSDKFEIILPCAFISQEKELKDILLPLWSDHRMKGVETHGGSFWIKIKYANLPSANPANLKR